MVWIKFAFCVLIIFFSGKKVAKYGDIIAEKTGLGGIWIGFVLISVITSLPELFTGISAVTLINAPDLTVGNLLGANAFNLLNLALLDIICRNGSLIAHAHRTHQLTGWSSLILVLVVALSIFISNQFHPLNVGWIGWYTPLILCLYVIFIRGIFLFERRQPCLQETELFYQEEPISKVYFYFTISAAFIIGAGIWLAIIGDEIAAVTGLEQSFVGSLFLAFTTTLPELTVSLTAMLMGAKDLAIANLIGSNLFNMTIISIDDLIYLKSPVLAAASGNQVTTALAVIVMTLIFIAGLYFKPKRYFRLSWWNSIVIVLFLISAYFSFTLA